MRQHRTAGYEHGESSTGGGPAPGKRTLSERLPVQRKAAGGLGSPVASLLERPPATAAHDDPFALHLGGPAVQRAARAAAGDVDVHATAARGLVGAAGPYPFLDTIQGAFGHHDLGGIAAHTGPAARGAAEAIGAEAYARGDQVAFAGTPDLHTAAHEAAHVVQQRAGVHLKGGVGAAGDVYERHADAVADAVVRGESAAALLDSGPAGGGATGPAPLQRKQLVRDKGGWREAEDKDDVELIVETRTMGEQAREQLRQALQGAPELLQQIEREWEEEAPPEDGDDLSAILTLGDELEVLERKGREQLDEHDQQALQQITRALLEAGEHRKKLRKKGEFDIEVQCITELLHRAQVLAGERGPEQQPEQEGGGGRGVDGLSLAVSPEDIQAYRDDVATAGTWAGWAEAEQLAVKLGFSCAVFVKRRGQYRRVLTIGNGPPAPLSLLFLGNHYEVVGGVVDGALVGTETAHHETTKGGDCLFESMLRIRCGGQAPRQLSERIAGLRRAIAGELTDEAIEESIQGMITFGDFGGLGPKMTGQIGKKVTARNSERWSPERLEERRRGLDELEGVESWGLDDQIKTYLERRDEDPSDKRTRTALRELLQNLKQAELALRHQRGEFDYKPFDKGEDEGEGAPHQLPLDRPGKQRDSDELEQQARQRTLSRKDLVAQVSPHCGGQHLILVEGNEFCLDKIGQLVPRYLRRNCSSENKRELEGKEHQKDNGLYPTGLSPFKPKANVASGTGDNKIKDESDEMHHVQGHKPSPYLSATASEEDALNPKGNTFGAIMTVVIDLAYIPATSLSALYTREGICYFLLDGFDGDKDEVVQQARSEQEKKEPSSKNLARRNKSLSEKEWQALLDVIRTLEVLIDCVVPEEAVDKQKN